MKKCFIILFGMIVCTQLLYAQSNSDNAKLPYEPDQISKYIYDCSIGVDKDKEFVESLTKELSIPNKTSYNSDFVYKNALISWAENNPELVEQFLIKRRDYQQGKN